MLEKGSFVWGPLFLLCALAIGTNGSSALDMLFIAAVGLYLSTRYELRGYCYSLILLGCWAIIRHLFFISDHLWQLGIEGSISFSCFITALQAERLRLEKESLQTQIDTRQAAIANLEEERIRAQDEALHEKLSLQEKLESIQKEFEELQSEYASILMLNDVLRKTTARTIQEGEAAKALAVDHARQELILKEQLKTSEQEVARLVSCEELAIQNQKLFEEANAARCEVEQLLQLNETVTRLQLRETMRVKEVEQEASALSELLTQVRADLQKTLMSHQEERAQLLNQLATMQEECEKETLAAKEGAAALDRLVELSLERERLQQALALAQRTDFQTEKIHTFTQEKMVHLSRIEPLFLQLKKQFEEKNQTLHQTRTHLFLTDTQLQQLQLEKMHWELSPYPKEVEVELQTLGDEVQRLEVETQQLEAVISLLTNRETSTVKKK